MTDIRNALAAVALTLSGGAAWALVGSHTEPFESWILDRSGDLHDPVTRTERRQAKALQRAAKDLAKDSESLSDDAKLVARALGRVHKRFADDDEFPALTDELVASFESDLRTRRASYTGVPERLDVDKIAARITKRLGPVDKLSGKALGVSDPVRRMRLLAKAFARLDRVDRTAEPAADEGDDRFLLVLGPNNSPIRTFVADRQTDATTLVAFPDSHVRTAWEQGETEGVAGNYELIVNWDDTDDDQKVDTARIQLFRLIGLDETPEAWYVNTFTLGLNFFGIGIDETPGGTRVTFNGVELTPDAGTNGAKGTVRLHGRLLLQP